jgi:small subunit ribosomal protein S17
MAEEPENLEETPADPAADTSAPSDDPAAVDAATSSVDAAGAAVAEDGADESTRAASSGDAAASSGSGTPAPAAEPEPVLAPKERRAAGRAAKAAKAKPRVAMSPEERQAERVVVRKKKAELRRAGRLKAREKARAGEHQAAVTPPREHEGTGNQKTRQGVVVSDKADKTITVRIDLTRRHRKYHKVVSTRSTLHAHDETNDAHIGDTVIVRESRPLSRSKRWRLIEVVERAK